MALNSRKGSTEVTWDGNWDALPSVLTCRHMAAIKGVKVDAIWDKCAKRTMRPKPDHWSRNYKWQKNRVMAELQALQEAS